MKSVKYFLLAISLIIFFAACGTNENKTDNNDTSRNSSVDSMPVVSPSSNDTGAIIAMPPPADSNVVRPDTNEH